MPSQGPLVVVIDEFQYLGEGEGGASEVASELNAVWERPGQQKPVVLVLSGSAVGTMEALAAGGGPLYGRFSWHHTLRPFGYADAAEMVPFESVRERALAYGIFGGTPRYLSAVDAAQPLATNAAQLLLAPSGQVRLLVETALEQEEGLRDVARYRAALEAVATGRTQRNEIAQRTGMKNDNGLRQKLATLVELGYLEEHRNAGAHATSPARYGVADAAFRFHQRFVEPNRSALERLAPSDVWAAAVAPHLDAYMGPEFERIARQAYDRLAPARGLPLVREHGRFEGQDRGREAVEIDIVSALLRGGWLTGEVKWNREPVGIGVH
jgi:AAA+ ATPase superfamily predicted ATPase